MYKMIFGWWRRKDGTVAQKTRCGNDIGGVLLERSNLLLQYSVNYVSVLFVMLRSNKAVGQ